MFEKIGRIAERAATCASRRQFLGRVGRGAMMLAAAVGGFLAVPTEAEAATVCGAGSAGYCLGKAQGAVCRVGRYSGKCVAAPICYCRLR